MTKKKTKQKLVETSFKEMSDGSLVESVFDPQSTPTKRFIVFNPKRDEINSITELEIDDGKKIIPLQTQMIEHKVILLPSDAAGYKSEKSLLDEVSQFIYKYLDVEPFFHKIASYYVFLSWVYDRFSALPYLRAIGDPGTGKSRFLQTVGLLLYKPIFSSGATTASPVFRLIEKVGGSLIVDEADFGNSDVWSDMVKILNSGYHKGFPVLRTEGDKVRDVRAYIVYSPKLLATRRKFKDVALESRMITQEMSGEPRHDIPIVFPDEAWEEAQVIRNKLLMWRFRNYHKITLPDHSSLTGVEPRLKQILLPLTGVMKDEEAIKELTTFAKNYQQQLIADRSLDKHVEVLEAIVSLNKDDKSLTMKNIADELNKQVDVESGEKKITPRAVGQINKNYLRLATRRVSGRYRIAWEASTIERLCKRYGVEFPYKSSVEDDLVETAMEIFVDKETSPKSTKSPSKEAKQGTLVT